MQFQTPLSSVDQLLAVFTAIALVFLPPSPPPPPTPPITSLQWALDLIHDVSFLQDYEDDFEDDDELNEVWVEIFDTFCQSCHLENTVECMSGDAWHFLSALPLREHSGVYEWRCLTLFISLAAQRTQWSVWVEMLDTFYQPCHSENLAECRESGQSLIGEWCVLMKYWNVAS